MPSPTPPPSLDAFRARAAQTGLDLTEDDIVELYRGYVGLSELMARIPADWAWEAEPAATFAPLRRHPR